MCKPLTGLGLVRLKVEFYPKVKRKVAFQFEILGTENFCNFLSITDLDSRSNFVLQICKLLGLIMRYDESFFDV